MSARTIIEASFEADLDKYYNYDPKPGCVVTLNKVRDESNNPLTPDVAENWLITRVAWALGGSDAGHSPDDIFLVHNLGPNPPHSMNHAGRYWVPRRNLGPITGQQLAWSS